MSTEPPRMTSPDASVWTSEPVRGVRRYHWINSRAGEFRVQELFDGDSHPCRSILPVPSAERHAALEACPGLLADALEWLDLDGNAIEERDLGKRIRAALARLEATR